jgi:molybdopterin synthase sulfur carrier subunit
MSIRVRYFASFKELVGRSEDQLAYHNIATAKDVWNAANPELAMPVNILAAVNMDYVNLDAEVKDGDEVAFFPPVTGG